MASDRKEKKTKLKACLNRQKKLRLSRILDYHLPNRRNNTNLRRGTLI